MKRVLKFFVYLVVFLAFFIIFLPKNSFYNLLEKELEKNQIVISNEKREQNLFSFSILDAEVFYQGINVAKLNKADFSTYLFYTNVSLTNIEFLEALSSFAPTPIDKVVIEHSILDFDKINIKANGSFGELIANINIFTKEAKVELNASAKMKTSYSKILKNMKFENERYLYEYKF